MLSGVRGSGHSNQFPNAILPDGSTHIGGQYSFDGQGVLNPSVQFGKTESQIYHAFRHTDALGLDRSAVKSAIKTHFPSVSSNLVDGKSLNSIIEIGGQRIQYSAFKLSDGTINIGRIHGVK